MKFFNVFFAQSFQTKVFNGAKEQALIKMGDDDEPPSNDI
ncbi:hypothetical protein SAMN05444955_1219 [Lihuaxuella thermophila]|uniref:Uncharacterized protein n=1 Tax=Lihuaxuella thermophila TaxID=1173111 RepID=A0A1H8J485_9BACL|nr:hypothetical protein SAMN05444955_1219 [Lihuaxuella thermophila]